MPISRSVKIKKINGRTGDSSGNLILMKSDIQGLTTDLETINAVLSQVNQLPTSIADTNSANDFATTVTGNVLTNDVDPNGDPLSVTSISYAGISRSVGSQFSTTYGSMTVASNGSYTFLPSSASRALSENQSAVETFSYSVSDDKGGISSNGTLTITIQGSNQAPYANPDTVSASSESESQTGNVLSNDSDDEGSNLSVISFSVDGVVGLFYPGDVVDIGDYGTFSMNANGSWTRSKSMSESPTGNVVVRYSVSDGSTPSSGVLTIVLSEFQTSVASNPVTVALSGIRVFEVGPGKTYTEVSAVPWYSLSAGDVVNIYHRSTPYIAKFGIFAQGSAIAPIIINGVTDANGNRPVINGSGATVNSNVMPGTSDNLFAAGDEGYGVITIKRRPSRPTTENPSWITIQNLEVTGGASTNSYINSLGTSVTYDFSAGIWCQPSSDITIRNCVIHDNSQGIFTMSKAGGIGESCQRFKVLYNRIYDNGAVESGYEHGCYLQGYDFLVEGNYLGRGMVGSAGSTYKSRIGKEVFRYNWVESTARAIDMVHPEFTDAFVAYSDFGIDYVYGNVIVNDEELDGNAWRPIHYGSDSSDGGGEWEPGAGLTSPVNHRKKLYFFSNTYFSRNNNTQTDQFVFQLSWPDTVCEAWGNIFALRGSNSQLSLMYMAGVLNLRGTNIISAYGTPQDYSTLRGATTQSCQVNRIGSVVSSDPNFMSESVYDFSLNAGSPALDLYSSIPPGIDSSIESDHVVRSQPIRRMNGIESRPAIGTTDLGAIERDPSAPPRSAPVMTQAPAYDVSNQYVIGSTISIVDPTWLYSPDTVTRTWQRQVGGVYEDIAGANGLSYTLTTEDVGNMRVKFQATNIVGTTTEYSSVFAVTDVAAATVVQIATALDTYPSSLKTAVSTMTTPPAIGNTLVVFCIAGESISDNYGNVWTLRQDVNSGYSSIKYRLYTCNVTATGSNFQITTATSLSSWIMNHVAYEIEGSYVTSNSNAQGSGGYDGSISITAASPNQRILAGFSAARRWSGEAPTVSSPWVTGARLLYANGYELMHTVAHGVSASSGTNIVTATYEDQQYIVKIAAVFE